jgi:hypothetical protein
MRTSGLRFAVSAVFSVAINLRLRALRCRYYKMYVALSGLLALVLIRY